MTTGVKDTLRELIEDDKKFIENLLVIENKSSQRVPFILNPIQADAEATETGRDIYIKPSQVGFSSYKIAKRLKSILTIPGRNCVLIAYEDFITERLLSKVTFFYNHLASLNIPGFPEIHHDSTYEKTFRFYVNGRLLTTSSIYVASARSFVAGRAETIHNLLLDEIGFYPSGAMERIIAPALARVPPDGTVDAYSTPNGEDNDFCDMWGLAVEGKSIFKSHFYPWFMHPEYTIPLGDFRIKSYIPETDKPEFQLTLEEINLVENHNLNFDQIRWRRWKIREMESLRRSGKIRTLFPQEFAEDPVSCFLATGDMFFDSTCTDKLAKTCYTAKESREGLNIWYGPEKGRKYVVAIDPGQAKVSQSAITVLTYDQDKDGNYIPRYCARDAGLYPPELTANKAVKTSDYYNRAMITWEANSHGLAITELLKHRRPIYMRKDIISGKPSLEPGWLTTGGARGTKDYMLNMVNRCLPDLICHDTELVRQLRGLRQIGDKTESMGLDDIMMSFAIALCCFDPKPMKRGLIGRAKWSVMDRKR